MSLRTPAKHRRALFVIRFAVAALLLGGLLTGGAALDEAAGGAQLCTMECCAGKIAHLAGECATGPAPACHAHLPAPDVSHNVAQATPDDPLCGVEAAADVSHAPMRRTSFTVLVASNPLPGSRPDRSLSPAEPLAAGSFRQPCQPNCGAGVLNASPGQRTDKSATLAGVVRARPPTAVDFSFAQRLVAPVQAALLEASRPRGPPRSFSSNITQA